MSIQRVVLWGFMASGKSVVGARLARRLKWRHLDLDREIVRRAGVSIEEVFRRDGEAAFRRLEVEVSREVMAAPETVFSTGGGWVTNAELLTSLPPDTLTVWLRVSPETVLTRVRSQTGGPVRPLLRNPDPEDTVRRLLAQRDPLYRRADHVVDADGRTVESIVREIQGRMTRPILAPGYISKKPDA